MEEKVLGAQSPTFEPKDESRKETPEISQQRRLPKRQINLRQA